jgi:hypothetical protein
LFLALIACGTTSPSTQTVTGSITATDAMAVRAIAGSSVVAATSLASDGSFALALPSGSTYRLELVTAAGGVEPVYADASGVYRDLTFRVCQPGAPIDLGRIGSHQEAGGGSGSGSGSGSGCGPGGGMGGHGGCDADPTTCGPPPGDPPCMGSGSDASLCMPPDGDPGMCPDHPPGDIGCGSGSGSA